MPCFVRLFDIVAWSALLAAAARDDRKARERWAAICERTERGTRGPRMRKLLGRAERVDLAGNRAEAIRVYEESVRLGRGHDPVRTSVTPIVCRFAELLAAAGDRERAGRELGIDLAYWRAASADWYVGWLERFAAERGITLAASS